MLAAVDAFIIRQEPEIDGDLWVLFGFTLAKVRAAGARPFEALGYGRGHLLVLRILRPEEADAYFTKLRSWHFISCPSMEMD